MAITAPNGKNTPLLTIAIPTYNRHDYLELSLNRLYEEIDSLEKQERQLVRVYVANNASTDKTQVLLSNHRLSEHVEFEAVHNEENIGAERNVAQCYSVATTPYVWILGDDDLILTNGLTKVLTVLQKTNTDILYVGNYHFIDNYLETKYKIQDKSMEHESFTNSVAFVRKVNIMLTFISALIVRTKNSVDYQPNVVNGTNLPQLGWVLPLIRDGKQFDIIEDKVVAAKGANSGGYDLVGVFATNLERVLTSILGRDSEERKIIQNGTIVNFFPGFILELRSGSSNFVDTDIKVGLKKVFSSNWRYYVFMLPALRLPLFFARIFNYGLNILRHFYGNWLV